VAGGRRHFVLLSIALLLAACGSTPKAPPKTAEPPTGKYYQDDGPPERLPEGLADVPDATPIDEPFHRFANRPYSVFGQTYVPVVNKEPRKERGIASWYGRKFHGQRTSSGETYDMFAMTAAHRTLPIPSYARVTNVKTGKSVVVRINDRGPFHSDRIIDLSYAAAARIGIVSAGSGLVDVERVFAGTPASPAEPVVAAEPPAPAVIETPVVAQENAGLWLQLGAFSSAESAESFRAKISRDLPWLLEPAQVVSRDGLHRVRLGPYRNRDEAAAIADKVRASLGYAPLMIPR
jgi:peptidoglycan lytic transglycosylase